MPAQSPRYEQQPLYINGQRQKTNETFQTIDPSNNQPLADVCKAGEADVNAAVSAAQAAFPSWSSTTPVERSRILLKAADLLRQRNDELSVIETHDTGKPFSETSTVDVITGRDVLEFYANHVAAGGLNGETTQLRSDAWVYTTKSPLGVCAGIGAWNYPIQIALWKSSPCLAAGNCMVYKPSEFTPLHALRLAEIYAEAGLPPGVFNVVHGAGEVGGMLTTHPDIAKVSFTGQVSTGCKVASSAASGMKAVTMELGGKSPLLVLPDADLETAVDGAMMANFFSTGQVCTNGTRVFVPDTLLSRFESLLLSKIPHVRIGDLMSPTTNFGPLVSSTHHAKVLSYIRHGLNVDGAKLLTGGPDFPSQLPPACDPQGFWVQPTVFTNCTDSMLICQEEIFGPVLCILPYSTTQTAQTTSPLERPSWLPSLLKRANATPLGLAAGVFSTNLNLAHHVAQNLEAGILWINTWGESPAEMSVGGWKMSGLGVENGKQGLEAWVRNKSCLVEMGGSVATAFAAVDREGEGDEGEEKGKGGSKL